MTILDWAQFYKSKGFSVIPLKPKGKKPAIESWKEYQNRQATDEELIQWFGNGSKNNIGIVTGQISGLAVIDIDSQRAVQFAREHNFPKSPLVKTGKEYGYHAYCKFRNGVRGFQKRDDLPDIDFRAEGNYVVAPPSIHESGKRYAWVQGKGIDEIPPAELPELLLTQKPTNKTPLKDLYKGVDTGSRNDTLARLAGSWVNDGLNYNECLENAFLWNQKNTPPLPEKEVDRTVKSIYEKHHRELSDCPTTIHKENRTIEFDISKALKKGSELECLNIPVEYAVDELIPLKAITLLSAKGGAGKSTISTQMVNSVSKGLPVWGLECKHLPVVYVDYENPYAVIVERIKKIKASDINIWHPTHEIRPPRLDKKNYVMYKQLPKNAVIVIDTLRACQRGDENDSQQMTFVMQRLQELRDSGFTVILLHHTVKSNERQYKGSTAIYDQSDHILSLYRVKKGRDTEIDDDNSDSKDYCYRLGTRDKTRYKPFHIYLDFDKEQEIFVPAPDPDTNDLQTIYDLLQSKGKLNQSQLWDLIKEEIGIKSKGQAINLLNKGNGKYWQSVKDGRAVIYTTIPEMSNCPTTYIQDNRTDNPELSETGQTDAVNKNSQYLEKPILSNCPDIPKTERTDNPRTCIGIDHCAGHDMKFNPESRELERWCKNHNKWCEG